MSLDDRDWYKDELRKKQGHKERSAVQKPGQQLHETMRQHMQKLEDQPPKPASDSKREWLWVAVVAFVLLCVAFYLRRKT